MTNADLDRMEETCRTYGPPDVFNFAAIARVDLPVLIKEVRRLKALVGELRQVTDNNRSDATDIANAAILLVNREATNENART